MEVGTFTRLRGDLITFADKGRQDFTNAGIGLDPSGVESVLGFFHFLEIAKREEDHLQWCVARVDMKAGRREKKIRLKFMIIGVQLVQKLIERFESEIIKINRGAVQAAL